MGVHLCQARAGCRARGAHLFLLSDNAGMPSQSNAPTLPGPASMPPKLNVLVLAASLRAESLNRKLAALASRVSEQTGASVTLTSLRDFEVPVFDGDLEVSEGLPRGAQEFSRRLEE